MEILYFIGAAFIFLLVKNIYDNIRNNKKIYNAIKREYGRLSDDEDMDDRYVDYGHDYFEYKSNEKEGFVIDDITANDIDLDYIFLKTDKTASGAGSACYYNLLRTPVFDEKEIERREKMISYFSSNEARRIAVQKALSKMPKKNRFSVYAALETFVNGKSQNVLALYLNILLLIASVVFTIVVNSAASILFPVAVIIYNIVTYYTQKYKTDGYIYNMKILISMINAGTDVLKNCPPELEDEADRLRSSLSGLKKLKKAAWAIKTDVKQDIMAILLDYANLLLHLDIISLNNAINCAGKEVDSILSLYSEVGFFDSMICIGSLRAGTKPWCIPTLTKEGVPGLKFTKACHFLLSDPVSSDIDTKKHILLTGSNASGKSTFLKTVALNALFAQTVHTCFAESYSGSYFKVITSMSLSDDIIAGESYYITEIKALKRIMDNNDETPVLCFADEILRGTNTVERIAASTSALCYLASQNKLVFAATHDIELTTLLKDIYENYHFSESMDENGDICFDYLLKSGPSTTRNAILMLKAYGYADEITDKATAMAEDFVKTGAWRNLEANI